VKAFRILARELSRGRLESGAGQGRAYFLNDCMQSVGSERHGKAQCYTASEPDTRITTCQTAPSSNMRQGGGSRRGET